MEQVSTKRMFLLLSCEIGANKIIVESFTTKGAARTRQHELHTISDAVDSMTVTNRNEGTSITYNSLLSPMVISRIIMLKT